MMNGLSIIVPAYNSERYIERCIESLLRLSVEVYEIIIVDDGSVDQTGEICERYQNINEKVQYFKIMHGGPQVARLFGIKKAINEYITFVDSDDWIDNNYYNDLITQMNADNGIDIGIGGAVRSDIHHVDEMMFSEQSSIKTPLRLNHEDALDELFLWRKYGWFLWGKVYRKKLFQGFKITSDHTASEDLEWNWYLFRKARDVIFDPRKSYHYFKNNDGITGQGMDVIERCNDDLEVYQQILSSGEISDTIRRQLHIIGLQRIPMILRELYFKDASPDGKVVKKYLSVAKEFSIDIDRDFESEAFTHVIDAILSGYHICDSFYKGVTSKIADTARNVMLRHRCLYVYGTGVVAKYTRMVLDAARIEAAGHVITNKESDDAFMGKSVLGLNDVDYNEGQTAFLLALDRHNADEVVGILRNRGYLNYARVDLGDPFGY